MPAWSSDARWHAEQLLIKLAGLLSSCGGPMMVMDRLKRTTHPPVAFLIGFLPVGLMIFGSFFLGDDSRDRLARRAIEVGRFGMVVMLGMQLYGLVALIWGPRLPDRGLYAVGIGVGFLFAVGYQHAARRFGRDRDVSTPSESRDDRPIEPS